MESLESQNKASEQIMVKIKKTAILENLNHTLESEDEVGFAMLPFVWAVNAIWFFNEAFRKPEYEEQKQIKKYVIFSAVGSLLWAIVIISWVTIFQLNRSSWGEFADRISFIIPVGVP